MSPKAWDNDASIKITALTRLGVCQDRKIGQFAKKTFVFVSRRRINKEGLFVSGTF